MKTIVFISLCLVFCSCTVSNQQLGTGNIEIKKTEIKNDSNPYSEIAKIYSIVFDGMTDEYFSESPDLYKEHTAALKAFIQSEYSSEKFIQQIVKDKYTIIFDKAIVDESYRATEEFKDAFSIMVNVSVPMAKMIIGGLRDIYVSKYVEKDPIKTELFAVASIDERQYVNWVYGEITVEKFIEEVGDEHEIQEGDRFFGFSSPPSTWEDMYGIAGFIHFRNKEIIDIITTMMN